MIRTIAIVQARMGSTRLPGKVLMELQGYPILWHIVERVKQAKLIDDIIIATSDRLSDNPIEDYCKSIGVQYYRGSQDNVLERFYKTAAHYSAKIIVRLTGDNPLVDPSIIDQTIQFYRDNYYRYVSNVQHPSAKYTFPLGIGCEVFSFELLKEAYDKAQMEYEKEHVTPYMYLQQNSIGCYASSKDLSNYRLTVDTIQDYEHMKAIYGYLFKGKHDFYLIDIIKLLEEHVEIVRLNADIKQRKVK